MLDGHLAEVVRVVMRRDVRDTGSEVAVCYDSRH